MPSSYMRAAAPPGFRTPRPGPGRDSARSCNLFASAGSGSECRTARPDLGERRSHRVVATAAEDRLTKRGPGPDLGEDALESPKAEWPNPDAKADGRIRLKMSLMLLDAVGSEFKNTMRLPESASVAVNITSGFLARPAFTL